MKDLTHWRIRRLTGSDDISPPYTSVSEVDEVHFSAYWSILVKRRRLVMVIFLIVFGIGAYFPYRATKIYTASATIKIEPQNPQVTGIKELETLQAQSDYYPTQFALLRSRHLVARVIKDLDLDSNEAFLNAQIIDPNAVTHLKSWIFEMFGIVSSLGGFLSSGGDAADAENPPAVSQSQDAYTRDKPHLLYHYLQFLDVVPIEKTRLVKVRFTTPDPDLSYYLANAHAETFIRTSLEGRFNLTKEARDFLEEKLSELKKQMERSEAALSEFRHVHRLVSIDRGENVVIDRLLDINKQLTAARAQRIEAESLYRTVENKDHEDLVEALKHSLIQQLKGNVVSLEAEKARASTVFKPEHPRIQELSQQITAAREALKNEIANAVRGIRSSYAAAEAKERGLQAEAEKQQQDALKLKEVGVKYALLQDEVNANRSLYDSVFKRLRETNVSSDLVVSNMQIVETAARPLSSSGPNVPVHFAAAMMTGLFFGAGAAFLKEYFDRTLTTPEEVHRAVGLPTLGVVPHFPYSTIPGNRRAQIEAPSDWRNRIKRHTLVQPMIKRRLLTTSARSMVSEPYRAIRTALLFSQPENPPQVVLVTSPFPGEGKTATSLNLSVALAHAGYSVLLIDADMRRGCCHERLGLQNNWGLSDVLRGQSLLPDSIQRSTIERLSFLARGTVPSNPAELLDSPRMKGMLEELRRSFSFVVIDSPPVMAVSDAAVLSVASDGVLLVFNGRTTQAAVAQKAVERLDLVRARLLGVVLNAVDLDDPNYSYYSKYTTYYHQLNDDGVEYTNGVGNNASKPDLMRREFMEPQWVADDSPILAGNHPEASEDTPSASGPGSSKSFQSDHPTQSLSAASDRYASTQGRNRANTEFRISVEALTKVLTQVIGPIAPEVIREQIAALGEARHAFPESRLDELLKVIEMQITEGERAALRQILARRNAAH